MQAWAWVRYAGKAIFAGVVTLLGSVAPLLVDGSTFGDVSQGQWTTIVLATVIAVGGVFGITNGDKPS